MYTFLPEAVRQGLEEARKSALKRKDRLSVHDGDDTYRIRRFWDGGFALDLQGSERLRGHVDIYDGPKHLYQCLVVNSVAEDGERVFEFKWLTPVASGPAPDFVRQMVDWGAGPRAGQHLILGGKAMAAMEGRYNVAVDDIRSVAIPVLRHRIACNFQAQAEGVSSVDIVRRLLEEVPEPDIDKYE